MLDYRNLGSADPSYSSNSTTSPFVQRKRESPYGYRKTIPQPQVPIPGSRAAHLPLQQRPPAGLLERDGGGSGRRGPSVPVPPGRSDPGLPGAAGQRRGPSPGLQAGKRRGPGDLSGLAGGFRLAYSIGPIQRWRASLDRAPGSGGQPGQRGEPGAGRAPGRHRAAGL